MNLARKYKLSKLGIGNLTEKESEIINFINSKLLNLSEFTMVQYPTEVFYMNIQGDYMFQYIISKKKIWIRYNDFCEVLINEYFLNDIDIENIVEYIITNVYKLKIENIKIGFKNSCSSVEDAYRLKR